MSHWKRKPLLETFYCNCYFFKVSNSVYSREILYLEYIFLRQRNLDFRCVLYAFDESGFHGEDIILVKNICSMR